ncbi:MAG: hypothetical protein CMO01_27195 [Thalassobius sp.]|nr:hypothetical protein [Thalassovita sp.]
MEVQAYYTQKKMNLPIRFFGLTSEQWFTTAFIPSVCLIINQWLLIIIIPLVIFFTYILRRRQEKLDHNIDYTSSAWVFFRSPKHIVDTSLTLKKLIS